MILYNLKKGLFSNIPFKKKLFGFSLKIFKLLVMNINLANKKNSWIVQILS